MLSFFLWTAVLLGLVFADVGGAHAQVVINPTERPVAGSVQLPKWHAALVAMRGERPRIDACVTDVAACSDPMLSAWRETLRRAGGLSGEAQLQLVNRFANRTPYVTDETLYRRSDYWASPLRFLQLGGDCEDYAIAKYAMLRQLGWPSDALRIVVLEDVVRRVPHAVLAVRLGGRTLVLDNVRGDILEGTTLQRYQPYFAVNETAGWIHRLPQTG